MHTRVFGHNIEINIGLLRIIELVLCLIMLFSYPGLINDNKMIIVYFLFVFELLVFLIEKEKARLLKRCWPIFLIVLLSFILQLLLSNDSQRSLEYFVALVTFLLAAGHFSNYRINGLFIALLKIICIISVFGTYLSFFSPEFFGTYMSFLYGDGRSIVSFAENGAYVGFFSEPSFNAYVLSVSYIIFTIELFFGKNKPLSFVFLILTIVAVFLTGKRSFLLIVPVVILFISLFSSKRKGIQRLLWVLFFLIALVFLTQIIYPQIFDFMDRMFTDDYMINLNNRDIIWGIAFEKFSESPLFGIGINQFDIYFNEFYLQHYFYYSYRYFAGAHNSYIQLLSELGVISLIAIFMMFYFFIIGCKLVSKQKDSLSKSFLLFSLSIQLLTLLYAISGNPIHQYQQLFMYLISVGIAASLLQKESRFKNEYIVYRNLRTI